MPPFKCSACGESCITFTTIPGLIINPDGTCNDLACLLSRTHTYKPTWKAMSRDDIKKIPEGWQTIEPEEGLTTRLSMRELK